MSIKKLAQAFKLCLIFIFVLSIKSAQAQESSELRWQFSADVGPIIEASKNSSGVHPQLMLGFGANIDGVFSLGLGTGVRMFYIGTDVEGYIYPYIPINLDLKFYLSKEKHIPFIMAYAGYEFPTSNKLPASFPIFEYMWGGINLGTGLGYKYQMQERFSFDFGVQYEALQFHYANPKVNGWGHYISVKLGMTIFK